MFKSLASTIALLACVIGSTGAPQRPVTPLPAIPVPVPSGPPGFTIAELGLNGSGCPPGSAFHLLNPDKTAVTVSFSKYFAEAGPGISPSSNRKNCQLTLRVKVPAGFTFGVASVDYRGYYQLDNKVTASQQSIYYFQGQTLQATARSDLVGPVDGDEYLYRDLFDLVSTVTSPCGTDAILNIRSDIRVSNTGNSAGFGFIANDSIDTALNTTFNFQWQTC